jgi:SAM-dependent methyltransferase
VKEAASLSCGSCGRSYPQVGDYWNFTDEAINFVAYETNQEHNAPLGGEFNSERRFVQEYLSPKLKRLGLGHAKILDVGCGVGEGVAELRRQGYEAYGVELWSLRASKWTELMRPPEWYYIANARKLPFEDKAFHIILCIGLIEHIGAKGDSSQLYPDCQLQRVAFLKEMVRVAKHGVLLQTPNRTFPADWNHRTTRNRLFLWLGRRTGVWLHSPFERFYVSYHDIEEYVGNLPLAVLPWELTNYFGFAIRSSRPWARVIIPLLNLYFRILDRAPSAVRKSWLNPWVSAFIKTK